VTLPDPPILIITDRRQCAETLEDRAAALFRGGCRWLSLREKDLAADDRLALLRRLIAIAHTFGATVGIHDDLAAALACRAPLHLPAHADSRVARKALGPDILIGKSCHTLTELQAAGDADYATLSPVFASPGKPGYGPALGAAGIAAIAAKAATPIVGLGGVTQFTVAHLAGTGIAGAAIMGEAMTIAEPAGWFSGILDAWRRWPN
jgi:thiamine-phosphate pyrophosphorylase